MRYRRGARSTSGPRVLTRREALMVVINGILDFAKIETTYSFFSAITAVPPGDG